MTSPSVPATLADNRSTDEVSLPREDQLFDLVYRQMRTLVGRHERDFEDLVQEAMEQALRSLPSFEGRSKFSTWTYQVCHRTVLKNRRWYGRWLRRFTLTREGELPESGSVEPLPGHSLEQSERSARLWQALSRLSSKKRVVVALHDLEGLPSEEIASVLEVKLGTVRSRLRDGRRELLQLLKDDPYFGEEAA